MSTISLFDLYVVELTDLYDVEHQILRELPLMAAGATSGALRDAFDTHYRQTQQHVERLERLFEQLEERPRPHQARALLTIIEDCRARNVNLERGEVRDAALIASAERIEHYEMAAYGCARAYAATFGNRAAVDLLNQTLQEERDMEQRLMALAEAGIVGRPVSMPGVLLTDTTGVASVAIPNPEYKTPKT